MRRDLAALGLVTLGPFVSYWFTLFPGVLRSDSGEFQFVPPLLGLAHPPGYAAYTLLGWLFSFLPVGDVAYRMNLLSAVVAALTAGAIYGAARLLGAGSLASLIGASAWATGLAVWGLAITAGIRMATAFATIAVILSAFWFGQQPSLRRLVVVAVAFGLAVSHHFSALAYLPGLVMYTVARGWRTRWPWYAGPVALGAMVVAFAFPTLYLSLRSASGPAFGPTDLAAPGALLDYITASGWHGSILSHSPLAEPERMLLFWLFLVQQFSPVLIILAALGTIGLALSRPLALILSLLILLPNAFISVYSGQSMPDYLLPSFVVVALLIAAGCQLILRLAEWLLPGRRLRRVGSGIVGLLLLASVGAQWIANEARFALGGDTYDRQQAEASLAAVEPGAIILTDWDRATPLWYLQLVEGKRRDVQVRQVTSLVGSPQLWTELDAPLRQSLVYTVSAPVALWQRFTLTPTGPLTRLTPNPWLTEADVPNRLALDLGQGIQLLGYAVDKDSLRPDDMLHLDLYLRSRDRLTQVYVPRLVLQDGAGHVITRSYTTDGRRLSTAWQPGEIVVERIEVTAPPNLTSPISVSAGLYGPATGERLPGSGPVLLTSLPIEGGRPDTLPSLADFDQRFLLVEARLEGSGSSWQAPWVEPISASAGEHLRLWVKWWAPQRPKESYTMFVQLLDEVNRVWAQDDSIPMSGSYHTYKWPQATPITEWRNLTIPANAPAGRYRLIVGVYDSTSLRRLGLLDSLGNLEGDFFQVGTLLVGASP